MFAWGPEPKESLGRCWVVACPTGAGRAGDSVDRASHSMSRCSRRPAKVAKNYSSESDRRFRDGSITGTGLCAQPPQPALGTHKVGERPEKAERLAPRAPRSLPRGKKQRSLALGAGPENVACARTDKSPWLKAFSRYPAICWPTDGGERICANDALSQYSDAGLVAAPRPGQQYANSVASSKPAKVTLKAAKKSV
jgi:hypothetical protein